MYRFRPSQRLLAFPVHELPGRNTSAKVIMHMILNNLNPEVAQYPHELVTYGTTG